MEYKDYYKILGVAQGATDKEIKAAYRKLARKHHPDVNQGSKEAEARFKEINEANEVLSDPEKRKRYDALGPNWARSPAAPPRGSPGPAVACGSTSRTWGPAVSPTSSGPSSAAAAPGGPDSAAARRASRAARTREGESRADARGGAAGHDADVAVGGPRRRVEVKIPAGDPRRLARARRGRGRRRRRPPRRPLPARAGRARPDLRAQGRRPADDRARPADHGGAGRRGAGADARRPGRDQDPAGHAAGQVFRLRGHGLPRLESAAARGDLLATLAVDLPRTLTREQRELFEELRRSGSVIAVTGRGCVERP